MRSLWHKLWVGFGGLLLILVAVSVLSLIVLTRYSNVLQQLFKENYNSAQYCDAMKAAIDQLNNRAQRMIWEESAARQINSAQQQAIFDHNLSAQLGNITLIKQGEGEKTHHLADLWGQYWSVYQRFDAAGNADRPKMYQDELLPLYQQVQTTAQNIADINMNNMVSVDGQVKTTLLDVRNALLSLVVTGTLIAALVVFVVGAAILRPLRLLTNSARQVEAGDLELHVPFRSRDEIGQLADAFNSMSAKLREFRKLDHERLVRTQQTTQLAIDSLPDAVFVIGPDGVVEISNRSADEHFGVKPGASVAALGLKWLTPVYEQVRTSGSAVEPRGYESAIQLFEGTQERFLLPRAVPMLSRDGATVGVTVIVVDVTKLHSADEAKGSVVSTVSHELRTPLTSIRMALGLLVTPKFGSTLTPQQQSLLRAAREESDRLYRIVENLLSLTRIESGRAQFQLRPMLPRQIVGQAVEPLRSAFVEKQIALEIAEAPDLPNVLADAAAINSALTNLLTNSIKYTPAGGSVRVETSLEGEWVSFSVSDSGPGIPAQFTARIFEKFFRVPRAEGPTGAGLGLAIAREVILAHGGQIELVNRPGPGCTFRFTLRRDNSPAAVAVT